MMRKKLFGGLLVSTVLACGIAACSSSPATPSSPSGANPNESALNPDGTSLKVTAPSGLTPNGGTIDTRRPTLSFSASTGRFQPVTGLTYDLEVRNAQNSVVYSRNITGTSHALETDLTNSDNYTWRVQPRIGTDLGPAAAFASFRTPDPPAPPPTGGGGGVLPFPVPAQCGPGGPANRLPCVLAVAALSAEWAACARGIGISCHRFTRQVVYSLLQSDPNWKMIQAAPGGNACNCSACGPSDGTMFREDTTVYGGNQVFDMITGAGGPTPGLTWSGVGPPRPGDLPRDAALCP
jgi:hypothetical protein